MTRTRFLAVLLLTLTSLRGGRDRDLRGRPPGGQGPQDQAGRHPPLGHPNENGHDIQVLPNKNVLLNRSRIVQEVTPDKKVVWQTTAVNRPESVQRLPNGNTLIADNGQMAVLEAGPGREDRLGVQGAQRQQAAERRRCARCGASTTVTR